MPSLQFIAAISPNSEPTPGHRSHRKPRRFTALPCSPDVLQNAASKRWGHRVSNRNGDSPPVGGSAPQRDSHVRLATPAAAAPDDGPRAEPPTPAPSAGHHRGAGGGRRVGVVPVPKRRLLLHPGRSACTASGADALPLAAHDVLRGSQVARASFPPRGPAEIRLDDGVDGSPHAAAATRIA